MVDMKNAIRILCVFFVFFNVLGSVFLTIKDLYSKKYFNEFENLKNFKDKKLFMTDDFLLINKVYQDTGTGEGMSLYFNVEGTVLSNNSKINLTITKLEYLESSLSKQPLYRSKLTGMYFLKDAPEQYYNSEIRTFYLNIYFKISFYIIIGIAIFLIIQYIKNLKYKI